MTQLKLAPATPTSCRRHNCTAIVISFAAVGFLYLNFEAAPAGADPDAADDMLRCALANAAMPQTTAANESRACNNEHQSGQPQAASNHLQGQRALLMNLLLLEKGYRALARIPDYTATFCKQESLGGELGENQVMQLKLRHEPFSVYMKWLVGDTGREVLYVQGRNNGDMLVKVGGLKGKFLPALKLNPTGSIAMSEARYPITKVGLLNLAGELIENRRNDLDRKTGVDCRMLDDQTFDQRVCYCFVLNYDNENVSELYRKSIVYIDKEYCLPVLIRNYTWPACDCAELDDAELDEATLIESYTYSNIQWNQRLAELDFDRSNKDYRFARR